MKIPNLDALRYFLAELIGTAFLVFVGCMGCVPVNGINNSHLQIVFNFALAIMLIIQIFACVSGGHLNPAISAGAFVYRLITLPMFAVYFVAQIIGGIVGFGVLKLLMPVEVFVHSNGTGTDLCLTIPNPDITPVQALFIEFFMTILVVFFWCSVWDPRNIKMHDSVPLKFGFAVVAMALAAGPWTGASLNPARSFGPAVWNGNFQYHWVYWIGPLAGGLTAAVIYKSVFRNKIVVEPVEKVDEKDEVTMMLDSSPEEISLVEEKDCNNTAQFVNKI